MVKIDVQAPTDFIRVCTANSYHFIFSIVFIFLHTNSHKANVLYGWSMDGSHNRLIAKVSSFGAGVLTSRVDIINIFNRQTLSSPNVHIYWLLITSTST